jgi:hypothetical protein
MFHSQPPTREAEYLTPGFGTRQVSAPFFPVLSFPIFLEAPAFVAFVTDPDEEPQQFDGHGRPLGAAEKAALRG